MRRRPMLVAALLAALGAATLAGCGNDDDEPAGGSQTETQQPAATSPGHTDHGGTGDDDPDDDADDDDGPDDATDDADDDATDDDAGIVTSIDVEAGDLYFKGIPTTLPAGTIEIELENVGDMPHDITIEELDDLMVVAAAGGQEDTNTVTLEPGTYTFYCSVPGHRPQMEVTVTVE